MDKSVKPGDNFFLYVNGNWLKTAVIPPDRSQTGSFQDLQILSETAHARHRRRSGKKALRRSSSPKRRSCAISMTPSRTPPRSRRNGLKPVQKDLDYLAGLQDARTMWRAPWPRSRWRTESIYDIGIGVDDKNPDNYSLNLNQSGLGLPDRDYYLTRRQGAGRDARRLSPISRRHDDAGGDGRCRRPRRPHPGAGNRNRQSRNGTAPTAATRTRSTIP